MWSPLPERHFPPEYFAKLYAWYAAGGNEIVADYLLRLDISSFDPKAPPPKTEAFWAMVDANRSPETGLLADRLEEMGRPAVVTLDQVRAGATEELLKVLEGPPRLIPHRFDECRYEAIRNPASERGNWKFGGKSVVVYGDQRVPLSERLRAIEEWRRLGQSSA